VARCDALCERVKKLNLKSSTSALVAEVEVSSTLFRVSEKEGIAYSIRRIIKELSNFISKTEIHSHLVSLLKGILISFQ